jgi:hypothetical protein
MAASSVRGKEVGEHWARVGGNAVDCWNALECGGKRRLVRTPGHCVCWTAARFSLASSARSRRNTAGSLSPTGGRP